MHSAHVLQQPAVDNEKCLIHGIRLASYAMNACGHSTSSQLKLSITYTISQTPPSGKLFE
eukprot:1633814-Pleurochrysis_carterae.AAC.5